MIDMLNEFKRVREQMDKLSKAMIIDPLNDDFFEVFTKKRVELIRTIMDDQPKSIRALSIKVERDIKNVFDDLKLLHNFNIVEFEKNGKCKQPVVKKKTIIFNFSGGELNE